jgi:hypothetical protein
LKTHAIDQKYRRLADLRPRSELAGESYAIAADPTGADASSQVIQILTDLVALKSSAKSLPAPSVVTVAQ